MICFLMFVIYKAYVFVLISFAIGKTDVHSQDERLFLVYSYTPKSCHINHGSYNQEEFVHFRSDSDTHSWQ